MKAYDMEFWNSDVPESHDGGLKPELFHVSTLLAPIKPSASFDL